MGYADPDQVGSGLRQRLYCRAFIVGSISSPRERIVYLVLDTQSGDSAVRYGILEGLSALGEEYSVYTKNNIAVTGTHSHSGPAAWLNYLLPQVTSKGFNKDSYKAIVNGSVRAIQAAHESLTPGHLSYGRSTLNDTNISRSLYAYLANPAIERAMYADDVDKDFTLLSFTRASDSRTLGALSWFPVHGTSLYQNNTLVTGDNKGVAAYLLENAMSDQNPDFVAGFSQANVGDTSPNTLGAVCQDTGLACRFNDSTCGGRTELCHGRGPQFTALDQGTQSCFEIGQRQYQAARDLLDSSNMQPLPASTVSSFHFFADLSNFTFASPFNASKKVTTCAAALGYGFAGGTTDGPGAFDFTQGATNDSDSPALSNPLWKAARAFIHQPLEEQKACQAPKPILLDVGNTHRPYDWTPNIVNIQLMRIGPFIMIVAPGEATTMSGRRWRSAIAAAASSTLDITSPLVVLGGPANTYAHYIATEEEYSIQRYEGASTLYGKHTLEAYINLTTSHIEYLSSTADLATLPPGPSPPINTNASLSFINPVIADSAPLFHKIGDCLSSPSPSHPYPPTTTVKSTFIAANPRNNLRLGQTYAAIEYFDPQTTSWTRVRDDKDWFLVFHWRRTNTVLGHSEVDIEWEIEKGTRGGLYRMRYFGDAKPLIGSVYEVDGVSGSFNVEGSGAEVGNGNGSDGGGAGGVVGQDMGRGWVEELVRL